MLTTCLFLFLEAGFVAFFLIPVEGKKNFCTLLCSVSHFTVSLFSFRGTPCGRDVAPRRTTAGRAGEGWGRGEEHVELPLVAGEGGGVHQDALVDADVRGAGRGVLLQGPQAPAAPGGDGPGGPLVGRRATLLHTVAAKRGVGGIPVPQRPPPVHWQSGPQRATRNARVSGTACGAIAVQKHTTE